MSSLCIRFYSELPEPNSCKFILIQFFLCRNNSKVKACTLLLFICPTAKSSLVLCCYSKLFSKFKVLRFFIFGALWSTIVFFIGPTPVQAIIFLGFSTFALVASFAVMICLYEKPRNFAVALVYSTSLMAYFQFPTFRECDQRWVKPHKGRVVSDLPFWNLPEMKQFS